VTDRAPILKPTPKPRWDGWRITRLALAALTLAAVLVSFR
jgi:hypothetical protein